MKYQYLKNEDLDKKVTLTLTLAIVKILHNACIDGLKENPEVTAYKAALEELQEAVPFDDDKTIRGVITAPKSHLEQTIEFATNLCQENQIK